MRNYEEETQYLIKLLHLRGKSISEIAYTAGLEVEEVEERINKPFISYSKHGRPIYKPTSGQVAKAKELFYKGYGELSISKELGLTRGRVQSLIKGLKRPEGVVVKKGRPSKTNGLNMIK